MQTNGHLWAFCCSLSDDPPAGQLVSRDGRAHTATHKLPITARQSLPSSCPLTSWLQLWWRPSSGCHQCPGTHLVTLIWRLPLKQCHYRQWAISRKCNRCSAECCHRCWSRWRCQASLFLYPCVFGCHMQKVVRWNNKKTDTWKGRRELLASRALMASQSRQCMTSQLTLSLAKVAAHYMMVSFSGANGLPSLQSERLT